MAWSQPERTSGYETSSNRNPAARYRPTAPVFDIGVVTQTPLAPAAASNRADSAISRRP